VNSFTWSGQSLSSISIDFANIRCNRDEAGPLEGVMWEALQTWPDETAGRRWPVAMEALLELAGRHPGEYEEIREAVAVLRALGG
jgi:hypothetical protein